jgi:hypothetical protein
VKEREEEISKKALDPIEKRTKNKGNRKFET